MVSSNDSIIVSFKNSIVDKINTLIGNHNYSGTAHSDIRNSIPTTTKQLTNNSGFLTSHQDISGKENTSNKVKSWSSTTNDTRYPSEKLVKDSLDNKANSSHTHTSSQITDLMSKVYPKGAIYISVNDTDPATLFGGTWQRLQDTFLYATSGTADTGYQATAGEATHTLTTNEIPAHTHNIGSLSRYTASGKAGAAVGEGAGNTLNYHTSSVGSGAAHNNMPPYMKVYMWKRTD